MKRLGADGYQQTKGRISVSPAIDWRSEEFRDDFSSLGKP